MNRLGWLAGRCRENGLYFRRGAGLHRCVDQFSGTGIPQHQLGPNRHLVGVIDGVEINQGGHGNLIGAGDLGEGLTSGHGVRFSVWVGINGRGLGLRHWLWLGKHGRCGQLQRLAKLNMISALKAVDGDQIPFTDAILSRNATKGVSPFNGVTSLASADNAPGTAWQTQPLPNFHVVGITDSISPHQASNRYAVAISET